jgi:hypothetical protein
MARNCFPTQAHQRFVIVLIAHLRLQRCICRIQGRIIGTKCLKRPDEMVAWRSPVKA